MRKFIDNPIKAELDLEDWDCASKVVDEDQKNYNTIIYHNL